MRSVAVLHYFFVYLKRCPLKVLSFDAACPQVSRETFIMLETLNGVRPTWSDQVQLKYSGRRSLLKLVEHCWAQDPSHRPRMKDVSLRLRSITTAPRRTPDGKSGIGCNDPTVLGKRKERGDPEGNLRASKRLRPHDVSFWIVSMYIVFYVI